MLWLVFGIGVGFLANARGRNGFGFFLLSAILSPLLGLIVVLVMENKVAAAEADRQRRRDQEVQLESIRAIAASNQRKEAPVQPISVPAGASLADELAKLAALRDQGILTEAEFQDQKGRMLAGAASPAAGSTKSGITFHRPPPPNGGTLFGERQ